MAREKFAPFMDHLLISEGKFVNDSRDPGGATMKGVTQRVYDAYRTRTGQPRQSVRFIADSEVRAIYKKQFWDAVRGDDLPAGVDYVVADGAVNSGPGRSVVWLQAALGIKVDGHMGEATVQAANDHPNHDQLVADYCARRLAFMKQCRTPQGTSAWAVFGKGWSARIAENLRTGQAWASGATAPKPIYFANMEMPADNVDHPSEGLATAADASVAGGGVSSVISGAATQIQPLTDASPWIAYIFIGLTLLGVTITAVGFGLRYMRNQKAKRAAAVDIGSATADLSEIEPYANDNAPAPDTAVA